MPLGISLTAVCVSMDGELDSAVDAQALSINKIARETLVNFMASHDQLRDHLATFLVAYNFREAPQIPLGLGEFSVVIGGIRRRVKPSNPHLFGGNTRRPGRIAVASARPAAMPAPAFAGLDALGNESPYSIKCTAPLAGQRRAAVARRTFPSPPLAPTISRPVNNNNRLGGNQ